MKSTRFRALAVRLTAWLAAYARLWRARRARWSWVARRHVRHAITRVAPFTFTAGGLTAFTVAAWMWHTIAGIVVLGVACFVLEWRVERESSG